LAIVLGVVFWTARHPSAAEPQMFAATLTGAQQVPPVASGGTGTGTVLLNAAENQIIVNLSFSGLPARRARLFTDPRRRRQRGCALRLRCSGSGGHIRKHSCANIRYLGAGRGLKAGLYYFNIHTGNFTGGEIRGQIGLAAVQHDDAYRCAGGACRIEPRHGHGHGGLNATENLLIVNLSFPA
jgi:hypothetical protein